MQTFREPRHAQPIPRRGVRLAALGFIVAVVCLGAPALGASANIPGPSDTAALSATLAGTPLDATGNLASVSRDGHWAVFVSQATNLPGNDNGAAQLYLRDLATGAIVLITENHAGTGSSNGDTVQAVISGDGSTVAFVSGASDLVAGFNTQGKKQLYTYDVASHAIVAVSLDPMMAGYGAANGVSDRTLSISDDGRRVGFLSSSTLTAAPVAVMQAYVVDRTVPAVPVFSLASLTTGNQPAAVPVADVSLSADGDELAFVTADANIVASPSAGGVAQAYLRNVMNFALLGPSRMVSVDPAGTSGADDAVYGVAVANDGSVLFRSPATNIAGPATVGQAYFRPLGGPTVLVSHKAGAPHAPIDDASPVTDLSISADASVLAFVTASHQLAGANGHLQAYTWTRGSAEPVLQSVSTTGTASVGDASLVRLSTSGVYLVFESRGSDLVSGFVPTAETSLAYVRNLAIAPSTPTPTPSGSVDAAGGSSAGLAHTGGAVDGVLPSIVIGGILLLLVGAGVTVAIRVRSRRSGS